MISLYVIEKEVRIFKVERKAILDFSKKEECYKILKRIFKIYEK